jgi:hypothetical protein
MSYPDTPAFRPPELVTSGESESGAVYHSAFGEVSPATSTLLETLNSSASKTWSHLTFGWLRRSWRLPTEAHNIVALGGALELDAYGQKALQDPTVFLQPNTNHWRYELLAGTLAVGHVLPIPHDERPALRSAISDHYDIRGKGSWRQEPSERHAELIDNWRRWLRSDGVRQAPMDSELYGEASILAAACNRIIEALNPSRHYDGEEFPQLVFPVDREPWRET